MYAHRTIGSEIAAAFVELLRGLFYARQPLHLRQTWNKTPLLSSGTRYKTASTSSIGKLSIRSLVRTPMRLYNS